MADSSFLTPDLAGHARAIAARLHVSPDIHPSDYIFRWHHDDPNTPDKVAALRNYFEGGAHTADLVGRLLGEFRPPPCPFTMLEFASGYGRLTRHWRNAIPQGEVLACDVHEEAVQFLRQIGCRACPSSAAPEQLGVTQTFDVVFALSFFTHMPRATWGRWLAALGKRVAAGGQLIFTTHGVPSLKEMGVTQLDKDGFWFNRFSEQKDLSTEDYGVAATTFGFVYRQLITCGLDLCHFRESGMGYQDLYVATPRRETGEKLPFADYATRAEVPAARSLRKTLLPNLFAIRN